MLFAVIGYSLAELLAPAPKPERQDTPPPDGVP
jgi:hypothetical protein